RHHQAPATRDLRLLSATAIMFFDCDLVLGHHLSYSNVAIYHFRMECALIRSIRVRSRTTKSLSSAMASGGPGGYGGGLCTIEIERENA
ncbi:unnamed protein product, partial [Ilex paraguariensis]